MAGTGTVTPIEPGAPTGLDVAQPLTYTLLSLPRYARLMGINPVHFQGATAIDIFPVAPNRNNDVWPRYSWQASDRVSHDDLAHAIANAERDIADLLGYWPAPMWIEQDVREFPRYYRRDLFRQGGLNVRGQRVGINARWGKIISPGQRAVTLIDTATVAGGSLDYTDEDADGFAETATVQLATTLTDPCEIKVYFSGTDGEQEWEIRPARSKAISEGIFTAVFDSWLFINPDAQSAFPTTAGFSAIDISTVVNYVVSVDVYREYTNTSATSATFYWEPTPTITSALCPSCGGTGCVACTLTTQDGCLHVRDANAGIVVPAPAAYSDGAWGASCFTVSRDPDYAKMWYYAGALDNRWLRGSTCDPLPLKFAEAIAWMATARLERPFCAGTVATALSVKLQTDLAVTQGDVSFFVGPADLSNPFGTRRGEVQTWRRMRGLTERRMMGAAV